MRSALLALMIAIAGCDGERVIPPPAGFDGGVRPDAGEFDAGFTDLPTGPPTLAADGTFDLPGCPKCTRIFVRRHFCDYMCVDCSPQCLQACADALGTIECEDH